MNGYRKNHDDAFPICCKNRSTNPPSDFAQQPRPCRAAASRPEKPTILLIIQILASSSSSAKLVQKVREGTRQYINVNNATAAGYGPFLGCVAGTDHGAMGVHYVNGTLLGNLTLDPAQPQALIYEPSNGKMTLVGVEFILDSASWLAANNNTPPVLDGQVFNFVGAPNRFNIPSFFELHVWAWRDNPQGAFVDWNNHVTCEGQ